ncbi:MAG TPA: GNAT family N-acetyltransferase [Polyangia bacterium]|nr:GNAT family N-acetyltransferase [Polyangia bacterium]
MQRVAHTVEPHFSTPAVISPGRKRKDPLLGSSIIRVEVVESINAVAAADWDRLAGDDDPFLEHAFLATLEASRSVGARAGCVPRLVLARDDDGRLCGAVPLYLKTNSYGEFIFDWAWANAAQRAGVPYYPKLVAAIPFTPATGQRLPLLPAADVDVAQVRAALLTGVRDVADQERASSVHFLFCTPDEKERLGGAGYLPRLSMQFHWHNRPDQPFESFDDYLSAFRSQNRKQVRKERRVAAEHGLTFRTATGAELDDGDWTALRAFYVENVSRHGGRAYLTEDFFDLARETLAHRLVATLAYRGRQPVAGTINFEKGAHLYGRYWGCLDDFQMLHFELCYYRLIDRAIEKGHTLFEAGAQGEHKLKRGLVPSFTHSAHWIRHPGLGDAIAGFLEREAEGVAAEVVAYAEHSPFRKDGEASD